MDRRPRLVKECHELRAQLKEWEKSFAETNAGRKPGKEDIRKNPDIATKYKTYNRKRDVLDGKENSVSLRPQSPPFCKYKSSSSTKRSEQDHGQTPRKILFTTPRKPRLAVTDCHPNILDPYATPSASVSPHPYVFKNAIGPTPQRDGRILGLFDLLSNPGSTPSTRKRKADMLDEKPNGVSAWQTPSRKPTKGNEDLLHYLGECSGSNRHSRTPVSEGKKFLLSHFFATPSTMRFAALAEEDPGIAGEKAKLNQTPLLSRVLEGKVEDVVGPGNDLESTPAYLRRTTTFNQRLLTASGSNLQSTSPHRHAAFPTPNAVRTGPKIRPFKGKPLSEILRGLRQIDDEDDEDELDVLREVEKNELNVALRDSQPLVDVAPMGEEPARTWRKKGQKRTTRRVIMRPTGTAHKLIDTGQEEGDEPAVVDEDVAKVDETQAALFADRIRPEVTNDAVDLTHLLEARDDDANQDDDHPPSNEDHDSTDSEPASRPAPKKRRTQQPLGKGDTLEEANARISGTKPAAANSSRRTPAGQQGPPTMKNRNETKTDKQDNEAGQGTQAGKGKMKKKGSINPNAHSHLNFKTLKIRNRNRNQNHNARGPRPSGRRQTRGPGTGKGKII